MEAAKQVDGMAISGVTLYDNGYAVFQREVMVQGHGSINLYFTPGQMKSVLESLQFLGDVGKKVGNIAYEATKPEASITLRSSEPLVGLLRSLVGRMISVQVMSTANRYEGEMGLETINGRILGVDERLHDLNSKTQIEHVSLLLEGGVMRTMPVKSIQSFHILEAQVQQDLAFSLDLEQNRSKADVQKLSVFFSDVETPQKLIARYGFSVNEWKSSYRMRLTDHPTQFQLDGLAIVENTLDEDWNEVSLTLVVGAPAIEKPSPGIDSGIWTIFIKGVDGTTFSVKMNPKDSVLKLKGKITKKQKIPFSSFRLIFAGKQVDDGRLLSDYSIGNNSTLHMVSVAGAPSTSGDSSSQVQFIMAVQDNLSYYPIPMKVNAKRKQKAIVPLLQVELEGQKVFLYDESIRKGNPLLSILFENTTGRTLEGGSIQIATDDVFLGQGLLPTLHPGDESPPIPFAVELGCEVVKDTDSSYLKPHQISISEGSATITRIHRVISIYRLKNHSDKDLDFLLNHFFRDDYDLVQRPDIEEEEPVDITDRFYQFRFVISARDEKKTFVVREEMDDLQEYELVDVDEELLETWISKKLIDADTERTIREAIALKKNSDEIMKEVYTKESEIREIESTQRRLRDNIAALNRHDKEASKYIKSLATEEDKLKSLQEAIKNDRQQRKELESRRVNMLEQVEFSKEFPPGAAEGTD